ncbi:PAS domain-containing protein [Flavobacterium sp. LB2P84]|uniref:sensor histidine kinase n=1 Tax=Flavobacterium yafengii TaxID=3041253 RepID=UPI0024A93B1D|nr:PAS domain-containing protein [Flavobacterium yafengii]MDI6031970.1 PAS domain-containing protein [Flavobacterium yafengii]
MKNLLLSISKANNHLLKEGSIDDALNFCITDIGKTQEIDRCYIFKNRNDNDGLKLYYTHEWCNNDIEPYIDSPNLSGLTYDAFPGLYETLVKNEPLYGLVKESENDYFRELMEMQGIKSYLFTPIFSDNLFWGWIGYDDCKTERKWADEEVYALHTVSKNIGLRLNQDKTILKLEATLEKFDFYMKGSNQAMWELYIGTNKNVFSYNWVKILGYTNDEITNDAEFWKNSTHPEDFLQIAIDLENFISKKSLNYHGTARMIHKDGRTVWVKYSGLLKKNKQGRPIKIIGTYIDISEIKEKEKELELSEEKFRFIAENTTDLITQHLKNGDYSYVSNSSTEIIGYTPEELINKSPWDFIHKDDLVKLQKYHNSSIKHLQTGIITYRYRKKDGSYIWLESTSKAIFEIENQFAKIQSSSRDITKRIKVEEEIKTALLKERKFNELKSNFVAMASHQFRTPLTIIYSNAELIDIKTMSFEKEATNNLESITSRIKTEVDRMTQLMNNILIFGKYESTNIKKNIKSIDFEKFIETLISTYFNNSHDGRKIELEIKGKKQVLFTDETLMVHILTNLISNAFKYSENRRNPGINIEYLEKKILIEVIDYGIGIPENEIQHIFTSFFRASNTLTIMGSGLGMSIVKQFTVFLNGRIELKTKENFGTKIKLIFPYEQK